MSPLQLSVYWRLFLIYFLTPFLFFLDVFTAAIAAKTCCHDNVTDSPASGPGLFLPQSNQSERGEFSGREADWWSQNSVCGWTDWLSYGQTVYMVGLLLGSLVGGAISDKFGKRPLLLVSACVHASCGVVPAFLPQPIIFLAVRCLTAASCSCISICTFSLGFTGMSNWKETQDTLETLCILAETNY